MRRKRNQSTAAAQKIMKERNYNLELIRMSAFLMVIAIHVTNYFCRAYGEVTTGEPLQPPGGSRILSVWHKAEKVGVQSCGKGEEDHRSYLRLLIRDLSDLYTLPGQL